MDAQPYEVDELPPYRALLVVDMKNFSGEQGRDHARITEQIPLLLEQAFRRSGLSEVWRAASFQGTTGDGYFAGFDPRHLPFLLNPFLPELQTELEYQNRSSPGHQPIRMRVSVTVGPMTDSGANTLSDGSGHARIEAHRMLDDDSVRNLLTRSNSTTCLAAITSDRVFDDVVSPGYSAEDTGLYVPIDVAVKTYHGSAYLRVPKPSGELLSSGFQPPRQQNSPQGADNSTAQPDPAEHYVGVRNAQGPIGTVVSGSESTVHTGSGSLITNPHSTGDGITVFGSTHGPIHHTVDKSEDDQ